MTAAAVPGDASDMAATLGAANASFATEESIETMGDFA